MPHLSRRAFLKSSAIAASCAAGAGLGSRWPEAFAGPAPMELKPKPTDALIFGETPTKTVFTYGEAPGAMPPVLRLKRGEPFAARLVNGLDEPTTIHWHGLRIPNAMDGVPFLTQPNISPGRSFDYAFTPPDAGTFWYHPHCNTLEQMGHGLAGVMVVEDPADPFFDAEIVLNLRDWRLGGNGQFISQFKPRDAARSGTFGTVRTANWQVEPNYEAPSGGIVRLRIAVTDVTRILQLKLEGAEAEILAIDAQPLPRRVRLDLLTLSPGQRADIAIRMPGEEGRSVTLTDHRPSTPATVATLTSIGPNLNHALGDLRPLAPNPAPQFDLSSAAEIPLLLSATAEQAARQSICGSLGYSFWAINKVPWPGDTADPLAPIEELKLGKSYVLTMKNVTPHAHPIHLHGMNFTVLRSTREEAPKLISDTYLIFPDETVQLGLVADNVGDWVFHCHIIEHQKTGMTGYFRVA